MRFVIIGAGATGLALAYLLTRAGHGVTVVEAASQPGGLLSTFDVGDGSRLEYYYHHFFTHDVEIKWLLGELGLLDRVCYYPTSMGVCRNGHVYPFNGLRDLLHFSAIGILARLRFGFSSALLAYRSSYADAEDTAALKWFERWAGSDATEAIWRPMLSVKFGEAAPRIPLAWIAGRLQQRVLSRKSGAEHLGYLAGSLQLLVDRLVEVLVQRGAVLLTAAPVKRLLQQNGRVVGVATLTQNLIADAVIATIPTPVLAELVQPLDTAYAQALNKIQYLGAVCTIVALREPLSNIYWLNIADPDFDFGGVIEHTNFVPTQAYGGRHIVYLSRYLNTGDPLWTLSDEALLNRQFQQLNRLFDKNVSAMVQDRWVFRARYAAPLPELGFSSLIPGFQTPLPGLYMASMCHIYPDERSVNNSIRVAVALAVAMGLVDASAIPRGRSLAAKYGGSSVTPVS